MPKPFADDGLWPDPDESDDGDGMELPDDEEGEHLPLPVAPALRKTWRASSDRTGMNPDDAR
jgi:hypothetical protein